MRKLTLLLALAAVAIMSCKHKPKDTITKKADSTIHINARICYLNLTGKDSTILSLNIIDTNIIGNLSYLPSEKDSNIGTVKGVMRGDTIIADYQFWSEGMQTIREIVLLKKENTLTEAYGEQTEVNGAMIYKDFRKLNYKGGMVFKQIECRNDSAALLQQIARL